MFNLLEIDANCNSIFTPEALEIIREILGYFRILAPIALIIYCAIDYSTVVISEDSKALAQANSKIVKRAIAVVLLFFVPTIVSAILSLTPFSNSSSDYLCDKSTGSSASSSFIASVPKKEKKASTISTTHGNVNNPNDVNGSSNSSGNSNSGGKNNSSGNSSSGGKNNSSGNSSSGGKNNSSGNSSSSGNGNSSSSNDGIKTNVGSSANTDNSLCLKNQAGLRDKYQSALDAKINAAGKDTRAAVVAAAIYMSSEIGIKIPYFPGGCHSKACLKRGIPENIGCQTKVSHNAERWPATLPGGLDCSGFTYWSYGAVFQQRAYISSEMHNLGNKSTEVVNSSTGEKISVKVESVAIKKDNYDYIKALLMPGDLIGSDGHVGMVINTSKLQSQGKFTVAHATSRYMQLSVEEFDLSTKRWSRFVLMRKFFLKYDCVNKHNQDACQKFDCITNKNCNANNIRY
jgi:cell wall-associated NlpC family hydrolase